MNELIISSRERDLGGFSVRRLLPFASHRMVGPFIFFDHMGPAEMAKGKGMDVRPHPHIHLSTVTYLFSGVIRHRDSLGSDQLIEPGAINWMTTGRGMVHSERSPDSFRQTGGTIDGIQLWVALPEKFEEIPPSFSHHPAQTLPEFKIDNVELKLLLGELLGKKSPVQIHSPMFYLEAKMPKGSELKVPVLGQESAVYVVDGLVNVHGDTLKRFSMAVQKTGFDIVATAEQDSHLMILGGEPLGPRHMFWNFVSSSKEKLEEAKAHWRLGPGAVGSRFGKIPGDDQEYIPLPES